jgi:hypothetical protein
MMQKEGVEGFVREELAAKAAKRAGDDCHTTSCASWQKSSVNQLAPLLRQASLLHVNERHCLYLAI